MFPKPLVFLGTSFSCVQTVIFDPGYFFKKKDAADFPTNPKPATPIFFIKSRSLIFSLVEAFHVKRLDPF